MMRTQYCGVTDETYLGKEVVVCGWVHRRRDHGGVIFVDLRDHTGLVQVVFRPEDAETFALGEQMRSEYVLRVQGKVESRPEGTVNADLPTGQIEIHASAVTILNRSATPPFPLDEHQTVSEDVRLRYRYIDLRRPEVSARLRLRSRVTHIMRNFLDERDFLDVETPILTKATPEGARDYLVPSRTHQGLFFALPQSPQIFKQLLMAGGIDRYYQIVRCFRDEDLRIDRQPEFTQLDVEMSFVNEEDVQHVIEVLLRTLFKEVLQVELPDPFPRMTYAESMRRFGTDRPDLRNPLELVDVADLLKEVEFKVFAGPANDPAGRVTALRVPKGGALTRKDIDGYTKFVSIYGAKGLAYIKVNDLSAGMDGLQSPILKFIPEESVKEILKRTAAEDGDLIFFGADSAKVVSEALGALRVKLGQDLSLLHSVWAPLWVIDFPMFGVDDNGRSALHHPFTAPSVDDADALLAAPDHCLSRAYDVVLNGFEIGGGSIRIHDIEMQQAVFRLLGIDEEEAESKFGHLLGALRSGCPPHAGLALGLDRLIMLMTNADTIRDVIAFPKTQSAACLLTDAPSEASLAQLRELSVRVVTPKKEE